MAHELHYLSQPHSLKYLGPPFSEKLDPNTKLPLLQNFFSQYVSTFPLVANNSPEDQVKFWKDTVEPFYNSFNEKNMSEGVERTEHVTKRHQVNQKVLLLLLLFYNSMLISKRDMEYLEADHVKASDQGKLEKLGKGPTKLAVALADFHKQTLIDDYAQMTFVNDLNLNIVAVDVVVEPEEQKSWSMNPMKMFGPTTGKSNYFFVVQATRRTKKDEKYLYASHFVSKLYLDFKKLESLLRKHYPGLMKTDVSGIPSKMHHDDGVALDESDAKSGLSKNGTSKVGSSASSLRLSKTVRTKFHREKLRLALRGYLCSLQAKPEIAHCDVFNAFLDGPDKFPKLNQKQESDYYQRMELEKNRLDTQQEFQENTAKVIYTLTQDFDHFKTQLVQEPHQLTKLFEELSHTSDPNKVSPLLRTFVEWCKLEVAATLYQVFLTQDNSSEWFQKCRKFHRLFPYNVCYGILKYTNPVRIMSRLVDVLLVNVPTFSWGQDDKKVHNLLSMTFVMLLDEDLEDYLKERAKLMESEPFSDARYQIFIDRIRNYVKDKELALSEEIKQESFAKGENLLMTILQTPKLQPRVGSRDMPQLAKIKESCIAYEQIDEHKDVGSTAIFVNLRQFWHLEVRARDKELVKQLWQEPELTQLLKLFLTVFFQPIMTVMKKCDIHLAFRDWQHFMNDLMEELAQLDRGDLYYLSSVEMFDRFKLLLDKHEGFVWKFMHNLYVKDDQRIFLGIVEWIEGFLTLLRHKFAEPEKVMLDLSRISVAQPIDEISFVKQLNSRIHMVTEKRKLLKDYLRHAANDDKAPYRGGFAEPHLQDLSHSATDNTATPKSEGPLQTLQTRQQLINEKWDQMNLGFFSVDGSGFGVALADVEEFNLAHMHDNNNNDQDHDLEHRRILQQVAQLDCQLRQEPLGSELAKLAPGLHETIASLFS